MALFGRRWVLLMALLAGHGCVAPPQPPTSTTTMVFTIGTTTVPGVVQAPAGYAVLNIDLVDAKGLPVAGPAGAITALPDTAGRFVLQNVPVDRTLVIVARLRRDDGRPGKLSAMTRSASVPVAIEVNPASTLMTSAVIDGLGELPGALKPASFKVGVDLMARALRAEPISTLDDAEALRDQAQRLVATNGELKGLVDELRLAIGQASPAALATAAPVAIGPTPSIPAGSEGPPISSGGAPSAPTVEGGTERPDDSRTAAEPTTPGNLTAISVTSSAAVLGWSAAQNAISYNVYQDGRKVGSQEGTTYAASGLAAGTAYTFEVTATGAGGESSRARLVVTTGSGQAPPPAPLNLATSAVAPRSVTLAWTASQGATSYNVYQGTARVKSGLTGTNVVLAGLTPSTTYSFAVTAVGAGGESTKSTIPVATTAEAEVTDSLPLPDGLETSGLSATSVVLSWNAVAGAAGYNVYQNDTKVRTKITDTSAALQGLAPDTTYVLEVTSVWAGDEESVRARVTVRTPKTP